ncbi:MAG TPA: DUF4340 domain-containing protein [Humisphaera sp.]|jgi:hypothetical protein|nr:DUF4340 domain-containing protein [Humisphaera sp.]
MNFRTTLILLVLVVAAGVAFFFTNRKASEDQTAQATGNEQKLLNVDSKDVSRLVITNADGKRTVLEKTGTNWSLLEPVKAPAKDFEVDALVNDLTGLQSRGQIDPSKKSASGLDHPSFTIELTGKNAAVTRLLIGDKPTLGDTLVVQLNNNKQLDVVAATIYKTLDKPASSYRKPQLVDVSQDQIRQLAITRGKSTIKLEKKGSEWQIVEPKAMPGDTSAINDLLFGITGLNATEFVTDDAAKAANFGLTRPRLTVTYSTAAPSTQPTTAPTSQPTGGVTIRFGDYEDVLNKILYAEVDQGPIAKVAATSEETFNKTPLDLRDKNIVSIDPQAVQRFTIQVNKPATTQPTTMPASMHEYAIERRKVEPAVLGPMLPPNVAPATQPASTQSASTQTAPTQVASTQTASTEPTTQPVAASQPATQPTSKWMFASGGQGDAEEGQVDALLAALHPLHVDKYLESPTPTTQPAGNYLLTIHLSDGKEYAFTFTDPGNNGKLIGHLDDLVFEADRSLIEKFDGDFKTKKAPAPTPSFGMPGGGSPFGG